MLVFGCEVSMSCESIGRHPTKRRSRGVIDTATRYTVAWDRAYREIYIERGIGHAISVTPESEVYRRFVDIH